MTATDVAPPETHSDEWYAERATGIGSRPGCTVEGCERPHKGHGLCSMHHLRLRRTGSVAGARRSPAVRFWEKVNKTENCWLWAGSTSVGYGRFYVDGHTVGAHRWAYESLVGPIPDGLVLDHLCRTPACVNPAHLEPVTQRENLLRGDTLPAAQARRSHCKHGHPYVESNLRYRRDGSRQCRECDRTYCREQRARRWESGEAK